jgi:hypothetical protein
VLPAGSVLERRCPFPLLFFLSSEKGESQEARLTLRAGAILDAAGEAITPPVGATRGVGIANHQQNRLPPMGATPFREPITGSGVTTGFISGNENCLTGPKPAADVSAWFFIHTGSPGPYFRRRSYFLLK